MSMLDRLIIGRQKIVIYVCLLACLLSLMIGIFTRVSVIESGSYSDKNHVAMYLFQYHKLPKNYITKTEALAIFGTNGNQPKDGRMIGGDKHFYANAIVNYTSNPNLFECDLSYPLSEEHRGKKRLVYAQDYSEFFYSSNHYVSFTKITPDKMNLLSNVGFILFGTIILGGCSVSIYIVVKKRELKNIYLEDLREVVTNILNVMWKIIKAPFVWIYSILQEVFVRN